MAANREINVCDVNKYANTFSEEGSLGPQVFRKTYKATTKDGKAYAIRKLAINCEQIGKCLKEIDTLKKLDDILIVPYLEYWFENNYYSQQNYQDVQTNFNYDSLYQPNYSHLLHIKLPLFSLTLRDVIEHLKSNYFDESSNTLTVSGYFVASQLFIETVIAVNYLHQQNPAIYHRDLKPENVLLNMEGLADFVMLSDITLDSVCYQTYSNYYAPEVNNFRQFSPESDAYSLGVIAYQLFVFNFQSVFPNHDDLLIAKFNCLAEIIKKLMSVCIEERPSCSAILENVDLWSLGYDDVRDDNTIKAIVSETKPMISKEDKFIAHFIRAKSRKLESVCNHMLSDKPNPDQPITAEKTKNVGNKQIFISYAHLDASPHARSLKTWLNIYGYDAFLDVDEIKPGNNWIERLNDAIVDCVIFVPLITPAYGQTKWTTREINHADKINKPIIPVSFIDNCPSSSIAIILAATHYIKWKTKAEINEMEDNTDGHLCRWEEKCVQRTAKEIAEELRSFNKIKHLSSLDSSSTSYTSSLSSNNNDHVIVFSCHPNQYAFANQLRDELNKLEYSVWISCDDYVKNTLENSIVTEQYSIESVSHSNSSFCSSDSFEESLSPISVHNQINNNRFRHALYKDRRNSEDNEQNKAIRKFTSKVNKASVVVLILSEDYCQSDACKQQAFYCDQRVPVVAIKYDSFPLPYDFSKVCDEENLLEIDDINTQSLVANLKQQFEKFASMTKYKYSFNTFNGYETKILNLAQKFKEQQQYLLFDKNNTFVYIASSGKSFSSNALTILKAIGKQLASIPMIKLFAGTINGCEEELVNSFIKQKGTESDMYYILPEGFKADNGQTLNIGQSVKERDSVASELFNIYLLIDSGDEAIRIAQDFLWNDRFVIPVINESNDALLSDLIKNMPNGVENDDWNALFDANKTADNIAIAVKNIIKSLNFNMIFQY